MAAELFNANRATTTVPSGGTDAPAGGTQETWTVASSAMFPLVTSSVSQFHVADPAAPSEIIAVTNVSGTTWTVTRGAESTTPVTHATGFTVYQVVTTGWLGSAGSYLPAGGTLPAGFPGISVIDGGLNCLSTNTTATTGTSRFVAAVGIKASCLRLVFTNWTTLDTSPSNVADLDNTSGGTITFNASIEVVATGIIYRVTFGGRTTGTLDPGGTLISDPVALDVSPGDQIACRTYLASGTAYVPRSVRSVNGGGFESVSGDLTAPGSTSVPLSTAFVYTPDTIIGIPASPQPPPPSVLIQGDSITHGFQDGVASGDAGYLPGSPWLSSGGYLVHALSGTCGVMNIAVSGDLAQQFVTASGHNRRMSLAGMCRYAVCGYGINDLSAGQTPAQIQANLLAIASLNARYGITGTWIVTICPNTSSTDGWITTVNQTVKSWEANRVTHNTWVRAGGPISPTTFQPVAAGTPGALTFGQSGHPIAGYFEVANTVETAQNSGLWLPADQVVTDAAITSGTKTLTCATSQPFVNSNMPAGSLGKCVAVAGAGAAGGYFTGDFISAYTSASQVTLIGSNASTTVTSATCGIGVTTADGLHPSSKGHLLMMAAVNTAVFT